jgi:hypothetical protein
MGIGVHGFREIKSLIAHALAYRKTKWRLIKKGEEEVFLYA